jgi:hypothetical protein
MERWLQFAVAASLRIKHNSFLVEKLLQCVDTEHVALSGLASTNDVLAST